MSEEIDYKVLLKKYISHVTGCEGVDFIDKIGDSWGLNEVAFTDEEKSALEELREND